jgi:DNA modification methylase
VEVFREVRRVLRDDGTLWLNLGDSYARNGGETGGGNRELLHLDGTQCRMLKVPSGTGLKPKDLCGIPWRVAFGLQADGWYLRSDIIWHKPNPMPESVTDRPTKAHEYLFLLAKSERYYYDAAAIAEDSVCDRMRGPALHPDTVSTNGNGGLCRREMQETRNKRTVWTVPTFSYAEAHFATFPPALIEPCILAGCPEGGTILDPFSGSGTTGVVSLRADRNYIGIELNAEYVEMSRNRIYEDAPMFNTEIVDESATIIA